MLKHLTINELYTTEESCSALVRFVGQVCKYSQSFAGNLRLHGVNAGDSVATVRSDGASDNVPVTGAVEAAMANNSGADNCSHPAKQVRGRVQGQVRGRVWGTSPGDESGGRVRGSIGKSSLQRVWGK